MVRNIWVNEQYREKNCTRYIVTSPDKNTFEILGINQFCREHNLSHGAMIGVAKGERKQHKGWICKYKTI
jgi:hypothetical protein